MSQSQFDERERLGHQHRLSGRRKRKLHDIEDANVTVTERTDTQSERLGEPSGPGREGVPVDPLTDQSFIDREAIQKEKMRTRFATKGK